MPARVALWALAAVTLAVYAAMAFWSLPRIAGQAGGQLPFDLRPFGYGQAEAAAFLGALSDEGRRFYLSVQHRLDLVFPTCLAVLLAAVTWRMTPGVAPWLRWGAVAVALGAGLADHAENWLVAGLLRADPATPDAAAVARASAATVAKSVLTTGAGLALIAAALRRARVRRARQARRARRAKKRGGDVQP